MATHNDITGDALVSRPINNRYAENWEMIKRSHEDFEKEFKVYPCDTCHIKVSTSNGLCPCCGKKLD